MIILYEDIQVFSW